jgi:hypothetical protein
MKRFKFFLLWGVVLGILIPGVGVIVALVMTLCAGPSEVHDRPIDEEEMLKLPVANLSQPRMERIVSALDFVPLVEIFAGSDIDLKRGAIEQLIRLRTPEAIQTLLEHRSDPSLEVRYYINAALARVKNEFDEELDAARHQMHLEVYKNSDRVFLAKIYLQYARSGLLDVELARNYEGEAIFHLTFVIDSQTPTSEAYRVLIECYSAREQWLQAEAVVRRARDVRLLESSELDRYQVMILYHTRRYCEIAKLMSEMSRAGELPNDWQTAALWWGGAA